MVLGPTVHAGRTLALSRGSLADAASHASRRGLYLMKRNYLGRHYTDGLRSSIFISGDNMNSPGSNDNVVSRLASQSDAIGRLAQNSGGFAAVVAAFESKEPDAYRLVLDRL